MADIEKQGFKAEDLVALDIGFSDIKAANYKQGLEAKGWELVNCQILPLPQIAEEKARRDGIVRILEDIFFENAGKKTEVICVINDVQAIEKRLVTPLMSESELKEAIFWKMKDFINFPLEDAYIDFRIMGQVKVEGETRYEIFALAFPKETINYYLTLFKEAKVAPTVFVSTVSCLGQSLAAIEVKKDETIAFVDLGAQHSELIIFKNKKFIFSRQLPVTGNGITKSLAAVLDSASGRVALTFEDSERLKLSCGIPAPSNEQVSGVNITCNQVLSLIRPEIEKLASEIEHSFDYYREEFGPSKIGSLCLIGSGANLKGLDIFLGKQLNMIVKKGSLLSDEENSRYGISNPCAVFSCLAGAKTIIGKGTSGFLDINLLPNEIRNRKKLFIRRLALEVVATVLVLSVLLGIVWVKLAAAGINKRIGAIKVQIYSLQYLQRESFLQGLIAQIYAREPRWSDVFKEISNIIPENIRLKRLAYDKDELYLEGEVLLGPGSNEEALSGFIVALGKGIFKNISLIESKKIEDSTKLGRTQFKLKCQVE